MAGSANTNRFMLSSATLMLGPMAQVYNLMPATDGVGMVKNFTVMTEPTFADLTQGSKNTVVYSTMTGVPTKATAEVFEYTAKNLTYALGLDGTTITTLGTAYPLAADIGVDVHSDNTGASFTNGSIGSLNVGDHIMIQNTTSGDDVVAVRKIATKDATGDPDLVTFTQHLLGFWPQASTVTKVNSIDIGSTAPQPFLAARAVGPLADGTIVEILIPKVRIVKGFTMAFNSEQYGNMPFELDAMDLVPTDTFYSEFKTQKAKMRLA